VAVCVGQYGKRVYKKYEVDEQACRRVARPR